ncbi:MAG: response regulator [Rhodothermales bacterium]
MAKKILVVDDELNVRHMLKEYLAEHGFEIETAANGREALFKAREFRPHLILLDVMMPELDGMEFMRIHRQENKTPIILLTARVDETDKVVGLELGADDYVTKPFGMRELVARIKAVLRRVESSETDVDAVLKAGGIVLDKDKYRVLVEGKEVRLTPTEFELLATMMGHPGRVYSRAQLLEKLHNIAVEGVERTVDVHIRNLRTKIEPDSANPTYIETVFGAGYRFADSG